MAEYSVPEIAENDGVRIGRRRYMLAELAHYVVGYFAVIKFVNLEHSIGPLNKDAFLCRGSGFIDNVITADVRG